MPIWRKLGLGVLSPLFIFLLFATAFDVGFIRTATHPATIKKLVAESGIYDSVVPSLLQQTKTINTSVGSISTDNPIVKNAANSVISPQYVKQNGEAAIDNIYQWLGGKISQPTFNFNLAAQQGAFANNVASSVQQQLAALPTCTNAQSLEIIRSGSFDSFNAACLPRGVSPAAAAGQVKDALSNNQDFASNLNLGAANIKNGSDNQSVFEQPGVKNLLKLYQAANGQLKLI